MNQDTEAAVRQASKPIEQTAKNLLTGMISAAVIGAFDAIKKAANTVDEQVNRVPQLVELHALVLRGERPENARQLVRQGAPL